MKKVFLLIFIIYCSFSTFLQAQWEYIYRPDDIYYPWECEGHWRMGSTSTFYYHFECTNQYSGEQYFSVYRTSDNGLNWYLKLDSNYEKLENWDFISADDGYLILMLNDIESFFYTSNGLNSMIPCNPVSNNAIFKIINSQMRVAMSMYNNAWAFLKLDADTINIIHTFPESLNNYTFIEIEFSGNNYYLLGNNNQNAKYIVLKSTENGNSWDTCYLSSSNKFLDIKFVSDNIGFMVGRNGAIFKTENAGTTWQQKESQTNWDLFSIDYLNELIWITAGENGTLLLTYDGGILWSQITPPPVDDILEVRFPEKDGTIVIRTDYIYIIKGNINTLTFISEETENPFSMNLFPNPANDLITITSPATTGDNQLSIFNVSGEKVLEMRLTVTETQLNISALPRGVYFVKVQDEKGVQVAKMVKQ